jgi:hypothetical protein
VVVAAYRMAVQGWSKEAAVREMFDGGFGYHAMWRNIPRYLAQLDATRLMMAAPWRSVRFDGC